MDIGHSIGNFYATYITPETFYRYMRADTPWPSLGYVMHYCAISPFLDPVKREASLLYAALHDDFITLNCRLLAEGSPINISESISGKLMNATKNNPWLSSSWLPSSLREWGEEIVQNTCTYVVNATITFAKERLHDYMCSNLQEEHDYVTQHHLNNSSCVTDSSMLNHMMHQRELGRAEQIYITYRDMVASYMETKYLDNAIYKVVDYSLTFIADHAIEAIMITGTAFIGNGVINSAVFIGNSVVNTAAFVGNSVVNTAAFIGNSVVNTAAFIGNGLVNFAILGAPIATTSFFFILTSGALQFGEIVSAITPYTGRAEINLAEKVLSPYQHYATKVMLQLHASDPSSWLYLVEQPGKCLNSHQNELASKKYSEDIKILSMHVDGRTAEHEWTLCKHTEPLPEYVQKTYEHAYTIHTPIAILMAAASVAIPTGMGLAKLLSYVTFIPLQGAIYIGVGMSVLRATHTALTDSWPYHTTINEQHLAANKYMVEHGQENLYLMQYPAECNEGDNISIQFYGDDMQLRWTVCEDLHQPIDQDAIVS